VARSVATRPASTAALMRCSLTHARYLSTTPSRDSTPVASGPDPVPSRGASVALPDMVILLVDGCAPAGWAVVTRTARRAWPPLGRNMFFQHVPCQAHRRTYFCALPASILIS